MPVCARVSRECPGSPRGARGCVFCPWLRFVVFFPRGGRSQKPHESISLRLPRCVSTGPVVVRLAERANKREREPHESRNSRGNSYITQLRRPHANPGRSRQLVRWVVQHVHHAPSKMKPQRPHAASVERSYQFSAGVRNVHTRICQERQTVQCAMSRSGRVLRALAMPLNSKWIERLCWS